MIYKLDFFTIQKTQRHINIYSQMFGINFKLIRLIVPKIMVARHDVQQSDPKNGTSFLLLMYGTPKITV